MIESFVAVFLLLILFHSYIGVFTYLWYDRICLLQQKDYGYDDIHRNIWMGKLTAYAITKDGAAGI